MEMIDFDGRKVPATYLGDAVYAIYDGYGYSLRLNDHRNEEGQIYLEPLVFSNLTNFVTECNKLREKLENERKEEEKDG